MDKIYKMGTLFVATLRAIYLIHHHSHWITKGNNFYGNHLLFQRLYEKAEENTDEAAEKMVGLFGTECLDYSIHNELLTKVMAKYTQEDPIEKGLAIENDFIKLAKAAYNHFEQEGQLSLGLDDLIMSIVNDRETAIYLLNQAK